YSFFDTNEMKFETHLKNHHLIDFIENESKIKQLKRISENQFVITNFNDKLQFNDLRFGLLSKKSNEIKYAFSYELYQENGRWNAKEIIKEKRDGVQMLKDLWIRLQGN